LQLKIAVVIAMSVERVTVMIALVAIVIARDVTTVPVTVINVIRGTVRNALTRTVIAPDVITAHVTAISA